MLDKFLITNHNYTAILSQIPLLYKHNISKIYLRDNALSLEIFHQFLAIKQVDIFINVLESSEFAKHKNIHLKSNELHLAKKLKMQKNRILSYAAHSLSDILKANKANIDYIFISPIFAVKNKNLPLGIEFLKQIPQEIKAKIFALGGIDKSHIPIIEKLGIKGIAGIRIFNEIFDFNQ